MESWPDKQPCPGSMAESLDGLDMGTTWSLRPGGWPCKAAVFGFIGFGGPREVPAAAPKLAVRGLPPACATAGTAPKSQLVNYAFVIFWQSQRAAARFLGCLKGIINVGAPCCNLEVC
ncbi:unnamed protein product [Polarella glacialis]|uniref:Uncharacterized protein n=1 Tax=Polarella glacialis TaxID=89957 RepID=A0A813LY61_POLGL|nr:unnamed protein product [Polarella glacialis]